MSAYYPTTTSYSPIASGYCYTVGSYKTEDNWKKRVKKKWTLKDLSMKDKEIIYKHIKQLLFERKVSEYMNAFKWLLFFIGLGILFNFGRILDIFTMIASK